MRRHVVVIGGGLTGLATAWRLQQGAATSDRTTTVTLLEASERLGGQIRTVPFAGAPLDVGADAFLARMPEGERLARDAGFTSAELVAPARAAVAVWVGDRLRPLPEATVLGAPTDLVALARSGVLAAPALLRAGLEPLLPRRQVVGDRSVADLVGERFGRAVVDRLVEPLLGGVYAGRADRLSAAATCPPVWEAAQRSHSLLRGLRTQREAASNGAGGPVFLTVRSGLGALVDRLAEQLGDRVSTGVRAVELDRARRRWTIATTEGAVDADAVVVALPAPSAAALLRASVPDAARELVGVGMASVAVVALAYDHAAAGVAPVLSGILVPRGQRRVVKAVTLTSHKWAHHADRDRFVVRASIGRIGDEGALDATDHELARRADEEVRELTSIGAPAVDRLVVRWPDALPQYDVGHLARIDRLRDALRTAAPGLHVAGAALEGVGLSARAREAERLAAELGA